MNDRATDERLMRLAIALGDRRNGRTWPNPAVGAVLASPDGTIIATGATAPGGRPHAEPQAIAAAGDAARGATLYVSLEPCSHHGRTPPCADAIVAAGIARVVSALPDPDPRVAGRGHARLRTAEIAVETGVGASEAERAHRGHLTRVRLGRPALTLKLAATPDGFAAEMPGSPRLLVTGEEAAARTHLLRARADAVAVGVGTVLADDPGLDVRLPGLADCTPVAVVFDSRLTIPPGCRLVGSARARPLWVVCGEGASSEAAQLLEAAGVTLIPVATAGPSGRLDLRAALQALAAKGLTRVFCEGGPTLADALAEADLVDDLHLYTGGSPLGAQGLPALGPALRGRLERGEFAPSRPADRAGPDRLQHYERRTCSPAS